MADPQAGPFWIAFNHVRDLLRRGRLPPGARLTAVDLADELRLSTTPVREALARLAGEGLLEERRGEGHFVRRLSPADVADLYRLNLAHLLIALEPRRSPAPPAGATTAAPQSAGQAVRQLEDLFELWVRSTGSGLLTRSFANIQIQLAPVRRREPEILDHLTVEAAEILLLGRDASRTARMAALRQFHGLRIRHAERLAAALERPPRPDVDGGEYSPNIG